MSRKILYCFAFIFFTLVTDLASGQQVVLERQVIGATGTHNETGNISISHTTGEPVVTTESVGNFIFTQGFHQSYRSCPTIDSTNYVVVPDTCGQGEGQINGITSSGGVSPVSFVWKDSPTWNTVDSVSTANSGTPEVDSMYAGTYYLIAVDDAGCADTSGPYNVGEVPGPSVSTPAPQTICEGSSIQLNISVSGGTGTYSYNWSPSTSLSDPNVEDPIATPPDTTTYSVDVFDDAGCVTTGSVTINVNPLPVADAGADQTICEGDSVQVGGSPTASGGGGSYSYDWSPGMLFGDSTIANPKVSPSMDTSLTVVVSDANTCSDVDTVLITVNDTPTGYISPVTPVCEGDSTTLVFNLNGTGNFNVDYLDGSSFYSPSNISDGYSVRKQLTSTTTFTLTGIQDNGVGCVSSFSKDTTVNVINGPTISSQPVGDTVCELDTATFIVEATGADLIYSWQQSGDGGTSWSGVGTGDTLEYEPVFSSDDSTLFRAEVQDSCGNITYSDSVLLRVDSASTLPTATASPDTICQGDFTSASITSGELGSNAQWVWYTGSCGGTQVATGSSASFAPSTTTDYYVRGEGTCNTTLCDTLTITVENPPQITVQPQNDTTCSGGSVSFSVTATGVGLSYSWESTQDTTSGSWIGVGSNNSSYGASPVYDSTFYRVIVSGNCTPEDTSRVAIGIVPPQPSITTQPMDSSVCEGGSAAFWASASGTSPFTYSWEESLDGGSNWNVAGSNDTLQISGVTTSMDSVLYRIIVTDSCGIDDTSNIAVLDVDSLSTMGTVSGTPDTTCPNDISTLSISGGTLGTGANWAWYTGSCGGTFQGNGSTYGVSPITTTTYYARAEGSCNTTACDSVTIVVQQQPTVTQDPTDTTACYAGSTVFDVEATGDSLSYQWQTDFGSGWTNDGVDDDTLSLSSITFGMDSGKIRVIVSGACAPADTSAEANLYVPDAPTITSHPVGDTVCEGSMVRFTVSATGSNLTYQWQQSPDGTPPYSNIGGATDDTLQFSAGSADDSLLYRAMVEDSVCSYAVWSDSSLLRVNGVSTIPSAIANPDTICPGVSTTLTIDTGSLGSGASWNWYTGTCGGTFIGSGDTISDAPITTTTYYVRAEGNCNTTSCDTVTVVVQSSPQIVEHPLDTAVCSGQTAYFDVDATGTAITYTWEESTDNGATWGTVGFSDDTLSLVGVTAGMDSNLYRVRVAGTCLPEDTSNMAMLTVPDQPAITQQLPASLDACQGEDTLLTIGVDQPQLVSSFNWQYYNPSTGAWDPVGTNDDTLALTNLATTDSGKYRVEVVDSCGGAQISDTTELIINSLPNAPMGAAASSDTVCAGASVDLTVSNGPGPDASWEWYTGSCGGTWFGSSDTTTVFPTTTTTYYVRGEALCGVSVCDTVTVYVVPAMVTSNPSNDTVCEGDSAMFIASGTASGPVSYQWQIDDGAAWINVGSTNDTLIISNSTLANDGTPFRCIVSDACGNSDTTTSAVLSVNPNPTVDNYFITNLSCFGANDGTVDISVMGGTSPFQFSLDSGITYTGYQNTSSYTMTGQPAGPVQIKVKDTLGCSSSVVTDTVNEPPQIIADAGLSDTICNGDSTVIGGTNPATGGVGGYSFNWSPGASLSDSLIGNPNAGPSSTTTYELLVSDFAGCTDIDSVTINLDSGAVVDLGNDTSICPSGGSLILDAGGGFSSYSWSTGTTSQTTTVNSTGTYYVDVTNSTGCSGSDTIQVDVDTLTSAVATSPFDTVTCYFNGFTSVAGTNSNVQNGTPDYSWSTSNGNIVVGANADTAIVSDSGTYVLTVTDTVTGCQSTDSIYIYENTVSPTAVITGDTTISCSQDTLTLSGASSSSNSGLINYVWTTPNGNIISPSQVGTTIDIDAPGKYVLRVRDTMNGCIDRDSIFVSIGSGFPTVAATADSINCNKDSALLDGSGSVSSTGTPLVFTWRNNSGTVVGQYSDSTYVNSPSTYQLTATDTSNGCSATDTVAVPVDTAGPSVTVVTDSLGCEGDTAMVDASSSTGVGSLTFSWSGEGSLTDTAGSSVGVMNAGSYSVTVTDQKNGCETSVSVEVVKDCGLRIYNAFSPDGDGENDTWVVDGLSESLDNEVFIYNRWGDLVNEFQDYNNRDVAWEGNNKNGDPLPAGTYFYVIKMDGGSTKESGWVQITR